jgi:hypothetical protein
VIAAMTTLPSRIGAIEATLTSLVEQTRPPDRILLSLPRSSRREGTGYEVPGFLAPDTELGRFVEIVPTENDFGPGTKLLGCLPAIDEPSILVLTDDDVRYAPSFLEDLVACQGARPDVACSYYTYRARGLTIGQGCDGFAMWSPATVGLHEWVRPHLEDPAIFHHDDVWISFFLARAGVQVRRAELRDPTDGLIYEQLHEINSLQHMTGDLERNRLTVAAVDHLMRHGDPTTSLRGRWTASRFSDALGVGRVTRRVQRFRSGRRRD